MFRGIKKQFENVNEKMRESTDWGKNKDGSERIIVNIINRKIEPEVVSSCDSLKIAISQLKENSDCKFFYQKALQRCESFLEANRNNE